MSANRHAKILDDLGGYQRVAGLLRMRENTVSKWRVRGIPASHWHRIAAIAPEITPEYLARTRPRGVQSRNGR